MCLTLNAAHLHCIHWARRTKMTYSLLYVTVMFISPGFSGTHFLLCLAHAARRILQPAWTREWGCVSTTFLRSKCCTGDKNVATAMWRRERSVTVENQRYDYAAFWLLWFICSWWLTKTLSQVKLLNTHKIFDTWHKKIRAFILHS